MVINLLQLLTINEIKAPMCILFIGALLIIVIKIITLVFTKEPLKDKQEPLKDQSRLLSFDVKTALISQYTNANGIERINFIDQKLYSQKFDDEMLFYAMIEQEYNIYKYGK